MRRPLRLVVVCSLAVACGPGREAAWEKDAAPAPTQAAGDAAAKDKKTEAMALWERRIERPALEQAIGIWEQMTRDNPGDAETLSQLSRGYYLLGDAHMRLAGETESMLATFEKGVLAGERAMMASSSEFAAKVQAGDKVEEAVQQIPASGQPAIYWYAVNLGKFANAKGFTTRLFYKDRIFAVMSRVLAIDETYFYGAPHRYFGAFYAAAPSFAGGDLNKSKEHFDKALSVDPRYLGTKVLYAEFYATKTSDKALFEKLLGEVKAGDPMVVPEIVPEQKLEQKKGELLMSQVNELFE
jgi:tetratricopeptide (TPR) repeat protein